MNSVTEFIKALGPSRLAAMGAVAAGLVGFFIFLSLQLSQPRLGVLYTDLTFEDSLQIVQKLEGMNIPHDIRQEGAIILAPKDRVLRLRMELAQSGLPTGGSVGYEIFDKIDTLGATSFVQNINRLRAIEGELARTIRVLRRVVLARVHLVLPKRELFGRESRKPTASIVLKTRGELDAGQIRAIQHLAASAVEGLSPKRVSIVNESGRLLATGQDDDTLSSGIEFEERNRAIELRMRKDIEAIVASIVGAGRVQVRVSVDMDYSKITKTSDIYDPDGQVVRSTQIREERANATTPGGNNGVSVSNELPSASGETGGNGSQQENSNKTEEVINYEISHTTVTETAEGGRVKRLSVAVLVDGIYQKGPQGDLNYSPRPEQQLNQIRALVSTAIGFSEERGDQVQVVNMRFAELQAPELAESVSPGWLDMFMSLSKDDYFTIAELIAIGLISLLVLLLVVRPLIKRIITPEKGAPAPHALTASGAPQLIGPDGQPQPGGNLALPAPPSQLEETLKIARVAGELQAKAADDVGETVKNNPDEAVSIVREWIQQST